MKSFYSKRFLAFVRFSAVCFIAVLAYLTARAFADVAFGRNYLRLFSLACGAASLCVLVFILVNPARLALFVPSLIYFSVANSIGDSNPAFPIIFMELAVLLLWIRGFFMRQRILKIIVLSLIYVVPFASGIRFGWEHFSVRVYDSLQIILVTGIMIFFLYEWAQRRNAADAVLNLADFPGLTKRDAAWLCRVQAGTKYEAIAREYGLTLGTVQNRLNKIYHILETGDRIGFLSLYAHARIVFTKVRGTDATT